ncbi:HAMP domain-containing protein, partial [Nocardioides pacificus]
MSTPNNRRGAFFRNLGAGRKLLALALACLLPALVVGPLAIFLMNDVAKANDDALAIGRIEAKLHHLDVRNSELKSSAYRSLLEEDVEAVAKDAADDVDSVNEVFDELRAIKVSGEDLGGVLDDLRAALDENNAFIDDMVQTALTDPRAARAMQPQVAESNSALDVVLEGMRQGAAQGVADKHAEADKLESELTTVVVTALVIGVALAGVLTWFIARMMTRPLGRTVTVLEAVAAGDLSQELEVDSTDEVGRMGTALNTALGMLRESMAAMGGNAQALSSASEELSAVSAQMTGSAG